MALYKFIIKNSAKKELQRLPKELRRSIFFRLKDISENPLLKDTKKLKPKDHYYRVRVGDHRIIYRFIPEIREILILRIRHRKNVYKDL
jgi:mRNA interferase RelE/StbE